MSLSIFGYLCSMLIVVYWGAFGFLIVCVSFDLLGFLRFCASWGSFTSILRVLLTWGVAFGVSLGVTGSFILDRRGSVFGDPRPGS